MRVCVSLHVTVVSKQQQQQNTRPTHQTTHQRMNCMRVERMSFPSERQMNWIGIENGKYYVREYTEMEKGIMSVHTHRNVFLRGCDDTWDTFVHPFTPVSYFYYRTGLTYLLYFYLFFFFFGLCIPFILRACKKAIFIGICSAVFIMMLTDLYVFHICSCRPTIFIE